MALKIYFAGPLFQTYEREWISAQASRLRAAGYEVFVPHEQVFPEPLEPRGVFAKDVEGLSGANVILAVLDGAQVDDGTACEIGMFWALMQNDPSKKRIIGIINDSRKQPGHYEEGVQINLFVAGAVLDRGCYCYSMDEVMAELEKIKGLA
ncbi:MAG: nucleoside 2-deoxyribosyltransferase [Bacillota bacterium]